MKHGWRIAEVTWAACFSVTTGLCSMDMMLLRGKVRVAMYPTLKTAVLCLREYPVQLQVKDKGKGKPSF